MKNLSKFLGVIALVAIIGLGVVSCASFATVQGVPQKTIPVVNIVPGGSQPTGQEIASYTKIIGIALGYDEFVAAVRGRNYDVMEKGFGPYAKVTAFAK
jgi:hypothetical protein